MSELWLVPDDDRPDLWLLRERLLAHGARLLPSSALVIEQPDGLRGQILDLVANELLTVETAADEIMRLLYRQSASHTCWFVATARGERCEKCGLLRAAVGKEKA